MKKFFKKYGSILLMIVSAIVVAILLYATDIRINEIPSVVKDNMELSLIVVFALFILKGLSGVILYNALIIVVSLIFPLPLALTVNAIGTAVTLSISYAIGYHTDVSIIDAKLNEHPDIKKYIDLTKSYGFLASFAIHLLGLSMEILGVIFGFMRIPFWSYLVSSWLAIIPGMIAFTIAGGTLDFHSIAFWIILVIDLILIIFGYTYTKRNIINKGEKS